MRAAFASTACRGLRSSGSSAAISATVCARRAPMSVAGVAVTMMAPRRSCCTSTAAAAASVSDAAMATPPPLSATSPPSPLCPPPLRSVPHPRVRALYKELLTVSHYHPTFDMGKCRAKIKSAILRNKDVPVYADGGRYEGYAAERRHEHEREGREALLHHRHSDNNANNGNDDHHNTNAIAEEELDAVDISSLLKRHAAPRKSGGGGGDVSAVAVADETDDGHHHSSPPTAATADSESCAAGPTPHSRRARPYSPQFMKALAWGRYGLRDTEALIHLHKYRAMKARYEWKRDDEEEEAEAMGGNNAAAGGCGPSVRAGGARA